MLRPLSAVVVSRVEDRDTEYQYLMGYKFKTSDPALTFFTALLAISTVLLAISTFLLWRVSRKQLDDVRRSLAIANAERTMNFTGQLFEFDKLLIANPELQIKIEELRTGSEAFLGGAHAQTSLLVQVKAFIYMHLNFFDEIISTYQERPDDGANVEYKEWCDYIIEKMRHPAYKEILSREKNIFGTKLLQFVKDNKKEIDESNGRPWEF